MKKGDLVHLRNYKNMSESKSFGSVGLVIELQTRGPVPGAYVFWPFDNSTNWVSIEKLMKIKE